MKSNQKHPRYKKGWPRIKTGLAEEDGKSNGWPIPPGFDRFESFGHDENIDISGAQSCFIF